jgi:hypothetical protein
VGSNPAAPTANALVRIPYAESSIAAGPRLVHTWSTSARRIRASRASASCSPMLGNRWPYRSRVTVIEECPSIAWIDFGCPPSPIARATAVWRRSWTRRKGSEIPARFSAGSPRSPSPVGPAKRASVAISEYKAGGARRERCQVEGELVHHDSRQNDRPDSARLGGPDDDLARLRASCRS